MKERIFFYGAILVGALTLAVHLKLYFENVSGNPYVTVTRTVPVWQEEKPTKAWEKAEKVTLPCVPVRAAAASERRLTIGTIHRTVPSERTSDTSRSTAETGTSEPARIEGTQTPSYPLLLGEWKLQPLPWGGVARAELDSAGVTHLDTKPSQRPFLEVGRLREFAGWVGQDFDGGRTWSVSYHQDIVRLGPTWLRGRVEYGRLRSGLDIGGSVQLGVAFRF